MGRLPLIYMFVVILCPAALQANSLRCYTCKKPDADGCPGLDNEMETNCLPAQDVCFEFKGDVVKDFVLHKNLTTKGCMAYGITQYFSGGVKFPKNGCTTVNNSKDPNQNQYYTGSFCFCNNKDFCNGPSIKSINLSNIRQQDENLFDFNTLSPRQGSLMQQLLALLQKPEPIAIDNVQTPLEDPNLRVVRPAGGNVMRGGAAISGLKTDGAGSGNDGSQGGSSGSQSGNNGGQSESNSGQNGNNGGQNGNDGGQSGNNGVQSGNNGGQNENNGGQSGSSGGQSGNNGGQNGNSGCQNENNGGQSTPKPSSSGAPASFSGGTAAPLSSETPAPSSNGTPAPTASGSSAPSSAPAPSTATSPAPSSGATPAPASGAASTPSSGGTSLPSASAALTPSSGATPVPLASGTPAPSLGGIVTDATTASPPHGSPTPSTGENLLSSTDESLVPNNDTIPSTPAGNPATPVSAGLIVRAVTATPSAGPEVTARMNSFGASYASSNYGSSGSSYGSSESTGAGNVGSPSAPVGANFLGKIASLVDDHKLV